MYYNNIAITSHYIHFDCFEIYNFFVRKQVEYKEKENSLRLIRAVVWKETGFVSIITKSRRSGMIVIDEYKSGREAVNKNLCRNRFSGWTMLGACNNERVKKPILRRTVESDAESWTDGGQKTVVKAEKNLFFCSEPTMKRWEEKGVREKKPGTRQLQPFCFQRHQSWYDKS